MFITATIRKLTGSFVVLLAAARFSGKRNQKGGVANPKVGMEVRKKIRRTPLHNILHPLLPPPSEDF